jgi:uncharacterized protein YndB with AHSA1/START domain
MNRKETIMAVKKITEGSQRSIVGEFELDAPVDAVWAALTDPQELANWFPLKARVEGRVGGGIQYDWEPIFDFDWTDRISAWEPNRHLAYQPKGGDLPYVVDFLLEGKGGKTSLRMVHSGIPTDRKWDDEYDSFFGGWTYELMSLQFYLAHHRGEIRRLAWAKSDINVANLPASRRKLAQAGAFFEGTGLDGLRVGDRYRARIGDELIEGTVLQINPSNLDQFAGTVGNLNNGLFRIGGGMGFLFSWLALYNVPEQRVLDLQQKLRAKFAELVGASSAVS